MVRERKKLIEIDRMLARLSGADPDVRFRAEIVLGVGALLVLTVGLLCVSELFWGTVVVGVVCLVGLAAIVLVLLDVVRSGKVSRGAAWFMTIAFIVSAILNLGSGGQTIGVSIALPSLVLIGALVLSRGAAVLLFLAVVAQLLLVAAMDHAGGEFLINPDPAWAQMATYRVPLLISVGTAFVGLLVRRAMNRHRILLTRTQENLAANEKQLREIIEFSRGLICTHSIGGNLLSVNPAAALALGYEVTELVGKNIRELVPEERKPHVAEYLARIQANGSDASAIILIAHGGELRVWEYNNQLCTDINCLPYVLVNATDMTLRRQLEEKLREQNIRDPLTGCFNRRYLSLLESRFGADQCWGCVIVDLNNFKHVNDTKGHLYGDEVLVSIGRFLNGYAGRSDAVIRMGGDEFLLLLAEGGEATESIAECMRSAPGTPCDISIGSAARLNDETLQQTIERADRQLYQIRIAERREDRRSTPSPD